MAASGKHGAFLTGSSVLCRYPGLLDVTVRALPTRAEGREGSRNPAGVKVLGPGQTAGFQPKSLMEACARRTSGSEELLFLQIVEGSKRRPPPPVTNSFPTVQLAWSGPQGSVTSSNFPEPSESAYTVLNVPASEPKMVRMHWTQSKAR